MSFQRGARIGRLFCLVWSVTLLSLTATAAAEEVVRVGGSGTSLGAVRLLGAAFERGHPGIRVQVFPSLGSAGGIMALSRGALDLALSSRPLSRADLQAGLKATEYARTPFVFIAHPRVAKDELAPRDLEEIYSGRTGFWPDGRRIRPVLRPESDTATRLVSSISQETGRALSSARQQKSFIVAVTDQESTGAVASVSGALGTSTLTQIVTEQPQVKVLAFQGVPPSIDSLSDGRYPLFTPLYLVTSPSTRPAARAFARFFRSSEGRRILEKCGNLVTGVSHAQ